MTPADAPRPSEGDVNTSPRRQAWARTLGPVARAMVDEDARLFLHQSVSTPCLTAIARAEGIWIEDVAGRRYMDFHGNNVHHIGYGHPRLKAAIARQLDELPFAPRRFTSEPAIALARKLSEIAPAGLRKTLFTTGGSDAIEVALKIARAATGRYKTISFWDSFHGAGFAGSALGGEQLFRSGPIGPLPAGAEHVAPFACYRCPYGHPSGEDGPDLARCGTACAGYLRYVLEREGDVAAVVAEPARATATLAPSGYWRMVREACDAHGALLIFDEIPTGLGKTGKMFACAHEGVVPDILVLGKALGGGMVPIAAVLCRAELDVGGAWAFGHYTHEKNPVTARAALTTIEIIEDENLVAQRRHRRRRRAGAHAGNAAAPPHDRRGARPRPAARHRTRHRPRQPRARQRRRRGGHVPRHVRRPGVQDDDGQRAVADAALDRHRGGDDGGAGYCRGGDRRGFAVADRNRAASSARSRSDAASMRSSISASSACSGSDKPAWMIASGASTPAAAAAPVGCRRATGPVRRRGSASDDAADIAAPLPSAATRLTSALSIAVSTIWCAASGSISLPRLLSTRISGSPTP